MKRLLSASVVILLSTAILAACSGGGGGASSGGTSTASASLSGITSVNYQPGSAIQTSLSTTASTTALYFNIPANAASQPGDFTITTVALSDLPAALQSSKLRFQADPANVFINAFSITAPPDSLITSFSAPIVLSGTLSPTIQSGTTLNLAIFQNNTWVDVTTATVGSNGTFTENSLSTALPGIVALGTYVLYQPPYPWAGTWVGADVSTCSFYSGPITMTITSTGGNSLNLSYVGTGITGAYPLTFSGNTATNTAGNVTFTLNGNTMYASEPDSCQTGTFTRQ